MQKKKHGAVALMDGCSCMKTRQALLLRILPVQTKDVTPLFQDVCVHSPAYNFTGYLIDEE